MTSSESFSNGSTSSRDVSLPSTSAPKHPLAALIAVVFCSTLATTMGVTILPAFYLKLNLTSQQVGSIEGFAWSAAFLSKFFAGVFSDRLRQRKTLIVWGTRLSVLSKACFAFATGGVSLGLVQVGDRFAKGLRSSPADALIADLTLPKRTGFGFGIKYAVSLMGSVLGGVVVYGLLKLIGERYRLIFGLATFPAMLACWAATKGLKEASVSEVSIVLTPCNVFSTAYKRLLLVLFLLMFGRFSLSFLGIKALNLNLPTTDLPRLFVLYDCCAAITAFLSGVLLCRITRKEGLFKIALLIHAAAHLTFFLAQTKAMIVCGVVLAGVHLGLAQSTILFLITQFAPREKRATALSVYYLVAGVGIFLSNKLAGILNGCFANPSAAFLSGGCFCLLAWGTFAVLLGSPARVDKTSDSSISDSST